MNTTQTGRTELFQDTIARRTPAGHWALLNKPEKGWASYAIEFATLHEIFTTFRVTVGPMQTDELGDFVTVKRDMRCIHLLNGHCSEAA